MVYRIIKTKPYENSVDDFLSHQQPRLIGERDNFKSIFSADPFDQNLKTHSIFESPDYQNIIFTSYVSYKIRLIWLMVKPNTIIPYKIMEDHDYHKIRKLYPSILSLVRYL